MIRFFVGIFWLASVGIFVSTFVNAEERRGGASINGNEGIYTSLASYSLERKSISQGFSKFSENSRKKIARLDDKKEALGKKYNVEVVINWFNDVLKVQMSGSELPELMKGHKIPSDVVSRVIQSMRMVDYSDGMSLGTLMDERPELAEKIARVVEDSDNIVSSVERGENPSMEISIPLSKIRAAIFSLGDLSTPDKTPDEIIAQIPLVAEPAEVRSLSLDQQKVVDAFDWPDTFILFFDSDPNNPQRTLLYEFWKYYEYLTQFDFIDGVLVQSELTDVFGDLAVSAKRYRPTQFSRGMDTESVRALFPGMTFADSDIPRIYGQGLTMMTGNQIIFGFEEGRLQYVESSLLIPEGGVQ